MFRRPPDGSRVCGSNGERSAACEVLEVAHVGRTLLSNAFDFAFDFETWRIGQLLPSAFRPCRYRRLGRTAEARASYEKALALTQQEPERQFLQEQIRQLK
jgi:hypothetical protein